MDWIQTLSPNGPKLALVLAVFGLYLAVILAFAFIYFRQFIASPASFVFASNIAEGQRDNRVAEIMHQVESLQNIKLVLEGVEKEIAGFADDLAISPPNWEIKTEAGRLTYEWVTSSTPSIAGGIATRTPTMMVYSLNASRRLGHSLQWVSRSGLFKDWTTMGVVRKDIERELNQLKMRIERAKQMADSFSSGSPKIWTFADFFYFSTIIQSTVGLGDIQPNATEIRKVVVLQILLGYAILIVVLNIILGWQ